MPADSYIAFSVTPEGLPALLLAGTLESSDDELGQRLASFEYLKRDGAEVEPMGAAQGRHSFHIVLMGSAPLYAGGPLLSAGDRYRELARVQRLQPKCLLSHPRLGRIKAAWAKIRATEHPQKADDCIELGLDFVEDQVDAAIAAQSQPTAQARAGELVSAYSILKAAVALRFGGNYFVPSFASVVSLTDHLAQLSASLAVSAVEVAQGSLPSIGLKQQAQGVAAAVAELLQALQATLTFSREPEVSLTPYRHQAYMIQAASVFLLEAVAEQQPVLVTYLVPTAMSLDAVLLALYGGAAAGHLEEVLALNRIKTPLRIPQGTQLQVVAPQVLQ